MIFLSVFSTSVLTCRFANLLFSLLVNSIRMWFMMKYDELFPYSFFFFFFLVTIWNIVSGSFKVFKELWKWERDSFQIVVLLRTSEDHMVQISLPWVQNRRHLNKYTPPYIPCKVNLSCSRYGIWMELHNAQEACTSMPCNVISMAPHFLAKN